MTKLPTEKPSSTLSTEPGSLHSGHYAEAIRAYEEFLAHESRYSDDLRAKTPHVRYNLGTALSAAGRNSEALACFKAAWEALRAGPDVKMAWTARSHLIREYLEADELAPAKALLQVGEAYLQAHPDDTEARIQHLVESAEYHYRRGDLRAAYATAAQGMPLVTTDSAQRSQLNLIAARVALAEGRPRDAFAAGLFAKRDAENAQRDDLVAETMACLDELNLRHGQEILEYVAEITGFQPKEEG